MDYEKVYVYVDFEDVIVVIADSKEQACEKLKEKYGECMCGLTPESEEIKTLEEFIEQSHI